MIPTFFKKIHLDSYFFLALTFLLLLSCNTQSKSANQKTDSTEKSKASITQKVDSAEVMNDVKYLSLDKLEGRGAGTKGSELAQEFIVKRFEKIGLEKIEKSYFQPFSITKNEKEIPCKNVFGKIEGTKFTEKYIVLTAHYDHLGIHEGEVFNGADDNASGVAAVLAAAKFFKNNPPKHSIIFVAFDAEESGLRGARYFVDNCPISTDNILLNINLDMISRNIKNEIYLCGTHHYPILKEKLESIDEASKLSVKFGHDTPDLGYNDWTNSSDHAPFHAKKIPFLYLGVEDHEDYHKATDTFEKIDPSFLFQSSKLVIDLIRTFDR